MAVISRSTIPSALDLNLNEIYVQGLEVGQKKEIYSQWINVGNSDKQSEKDDFMTGFGLTPQKAEGAAASYGSVYAGISKVYTNVTYALGYELTEEAVSDNKHTPQTFDKLPAALSRSNMQTVETLAHDVLNTGFSGATGAATGYDGQYLFSTAHPLIGGGTQANTPSTQADLSGSTLIAGITALDTQVDEQSLKMPLTSRLLLVPAALWATAVELTKSEFKPFVANNEVNALMERGLQTLSSVYITDSDSWFLLADKQNHKLKFFWRTRPGNLRKGTDFDSMNLKHLSWFRCSAGYSHYSGTYGSSGG